jgi:hypothetical protein
VTETEERQQIAEHLRAAAATLRDRATTATPGLWQHMCLGSEGCLVLRATGTIRERGHGRVARFGSKDWQADHADAAYVAMMAPPVAEALAAWLEVKAANPGDHDYGYALALAGAVNASGHRCHAQDITVSLRAARFPRVKRLASSLE